MKLIWPTTSWDNPTHPETIFSEDDWPWQSEYLEEFGIGYAEPLEDPTHYYED